MDTLHEWHTPEAKRILAEMGVSERNWRFFMLHNGFADGHVWSLAEIANAEEKDISRVRVFQIVKKTRKRLQLYIISQK